MPNQNQSHGRGCDLSKVPKAADTPPADIKKLLGVDSSNPFLRALRIESGILNVANLPPELTSKVPLEGSELAKLLEEQK